jgi:hypothetical protein
MGVLGILKTIDTTKMKLSTSYKVKKVLNVCEDAVGDFEKRRIAMASSYGVLNEEKTYYLFEKEGSQEEFEKDMQSMLDDEIDISIEKIPLSLVDDLIVIEPAAIDMISWLIDFEA